MTINNLVSDSSYVEYNGKKYDNIYSAVESASDTVSRMTIRIYDTKYGSYEDIKLKRGRSGNFIYTAYVVLDVNGAVYAEEINTAHEAVSIANEIGGSALEVEQTLYETIESKVLYCHNRTEV